MPKTYNSVVNFAVYEGGVNFCGVASVVLPSISYKTQTISGAGIGGDIERVSPGMVDAMSATIKFLAPSVEQAKLTKQQYHTIHLMVAQNYTDTVRGQNGTDAVKYVMRIFPKKTDFGEASPAGKMDASGEYSVEYFAKYINGKIDTEVDPVNMICMVDGFDSLADVRKAIGM